MTATVDWRQYAEVRADWRAAALVALFGVVIAGSLAFRPALITAGAEPVTGGTSGGQQAAAGVGWAVLEAAIAAMLLGIILAWRRTPEWLQTAMQHTLRLAFWLVIGFVATDVLGFMPGLAVTLGGMFLLRVTDELGIWWAINDVLALATAVYFAASVGIALGPVIIGVGLVGLSAYDYYFADRKPWMFALAGATIRWKLPMVFVVPRRWRLDWDRFAEFDSDDEGQVGFAIGMADLLLPAAFAVALANTGGGLPLYGAVGGTLVACLRVSQKINQGGGAGMPPLTTGALSGWAIATVAAIVVVA